MDETLSFFTAETIVCLTLVPLDVFFLIGSITPNKKKERIYTILAVTVLLVMLALLIKYLKYTI